MRQTVTSIACRYDGMLLMQQNYPELLKQQVEKYESGGKVIPSKSDDTTRKEHYIVYAAPQGTDHRSGHFRRSCENNQDERVSREAV